MTPELIIFDCDGVLVDSEPVTNALLVENLNSHGLSVTFDECMELFVGGTMMGVEKEARARGANLPENWLDQIYGEMFVRLRAGVPTIKGVLDLIESADEAGIAKAIASNGPMEKMRCTLPPVDLWDRFKPYIYSREDHAPKPKPDMLLHAMKLSGVSRENTVMIDDSPSGCMAGINAGVRCIGYAAEGQGSRLEEVGAEVHETMASITNALGL